MAVVTVRIFRKSDVKSNPDGKPVWEQIDPRELNPAALSGSARAGVSAVSGRVYGGAPRTARGPQGSARKNEPRGGEVDETAAQELYLFIQNDADLYRQQFEPIVKNLNRKRAKGTYDSELSVRLWMYLVDNGARKYLKEFGTPGDRIDVVFNRATRLSVARQLRDDYEAEAGVRSNYATPHIRKINEWDVDYNAAYVSPAPRARGPTRISGIHGKKNPVMVLVNAKVSPEHFLVLVNKPTEETE